METTTNVDTNTNKSVTQVIKQIDQETQAKLQSLSSTNEVNVQSLEKIMSEGGEQFHKETGRHMTYQEMRRMFG
jgi:hypothetical protein